MLDSFMGSKKKSEVHFLLTKVMTQGMLRELMMTVHMTVSWRELGKTF